MTCCWPSAIGCSLRPGANGLPGTLWGYPFVQMIHFSGLSLWLGPNLTVDLRLLGIGKQRQTAAELSRALFVLNWVAFCFVLLGGFLLFSGSASTYIVNIAFEYKLGIFVPLALLWHIVVQRKTRVWGRTTQVPASPGSRACSKRSYGCAWSPRLSKYQIIRDADAHARSCEYVRQRMTSN